MKRTKVTDREWLSRYDKERILSKSEGRCCHCGKHIEVGKDFTVEHAIPISKGGTNKDWNLIALCKDCNDTKADAVVDAAYYFKYLNSDSLSLLVSKQDEYFDDVNWLDMKNLTKEDITTIKVLSQSIDTMEAVPVGKRKKNIRLKPREFNYKLMKAVYKDLDEVYNLWICYSKEYGVGNSNTEIRQMISDIFQRGAIYIIRDEVDRLLCAFPVAFTNEVNIFGDSRCVLKMFITPHVDMDANMSEVMYRALCYVIENLKQLFCAYAAVPMVISYATNDMLWSLGNKHRIGSSLSWPYKEESGITSQYVIYENDGSYIDDFDGTFDNFSQAIVDKTGMNISKLLHA